MKYKFADISVEKCRYKLFRNVLTRKFSKHSMTTLRAPTETRTERTILCSCPRTSVYERLSVSLNESLTNGPTASWKKYISERIFAREKTVWRTYVWEGERKSGWEGDGKKRKSFYDPANPHPFLCRGVDIFISMRNLLGLRFDRGAGRREMRRERETLVEEEGVGNIMKREPKEKR